MFWSTDTTSEISGTPAAPREGRGPVSERLREQLQERLLVALDFATLGAYELTAPEGDAELAGAERTGALREAERPLGAAEPAQADALSGDALHLPDARRERPQRVFLFAKAV